MKQFMLFWASLLVTCALFATDATVATPETLTDATVATPETLTVDDITPEMLNEPGMVSADLMMEYIEKEAAKNVSPDETPSIAIRTLATIGKGGVILMEATEDLLRKINTGLTGFFNTSIESNAYVVSFVAVCTLILFILWFTMSIFHEVTRPAISCRSWYRYFATASGISFAIFHLVSPDSPHLEDFWATAIVPLFCNLLTLLLVTCSLIKAIKTKKSGVRTAIILLICDFLVGFVAAILIVPLFGAILVVVVLRIIFKVLSWKPETEWERCLRELDEWLEEHYRKSYNKKA